MKNCAAAAPAVWSIHDLKPSERLVLWSLRYWTACKRQSKPCGDLLREVYANNGMTGAASQLGALMDLVSATARKPPGIRCTACPLLSADERAILDAVANRHVNQAMAASDALIDFVDSMFDTMEREVDPSLLDCSLEPLIVRPRKD